MLHRRFLLGAPLVLASCSSVLPAQKYVPRANWPLQPPPPQTQTGSGHGPVLLVRAITAAPGQDARGLQTLTQDGSLNLDYYNLWAVPPANALTQALVNWAQASGQFSAVTVPGSRLTAGLILEGELTQLLVDLPAAQAKGALSLTIIKPSTGTAGFAQPLAQLSLTASAPVQGEGAAAQAAAQNAVVSNLLSQAMAQLARYTGG